MRWVYWMIKYYGYAIVLQEIPDEISLAIEITNCPHRCKNCHSPHLRNNVGNKLTKDEIDTLIKKQPHITCVLFLGGDNNHSDIIKLADYIHTKYQYKYLVGMYSGDDDVDGKLLSHLDYYKVGSYQEDKGPLNNPNTNQRLYQILIGGAKDITYKFWNKK